MSASVRVESRVTYAEAKLAEAYKLFALANEAVEAGNLQLAIQHWRHAYRLAPDDPTMIYCRGVEALSSWRFPEAVRYLTRTCNSKQYKDNAQAHYHLGCAARGAGDFRQSAQSFRRTLTLDPYHVGAMIGRGFAFQLHGDHERAEALFAKALALPGRSPSDRNEQATCGAWWGDYSRWSLFENRWRTGLRPQSPALEAILNERRWNGAPFRGTLMLWAEQGMGDTLLMARYLPLAQERCTHLVVLVQASMVTLFQHAGYDAQPITGVLPAFGAHSPMMSLPWLMGTDSVAKIPPPADFKIPLTTRTGHAGLCWAGGPVANLDRNSPTRAFAPLLTMPGVVWHNMQFGAREDEYPELGPPSRGDWLETAREVATLDVVVTVDTALSHLAGSLGVTTFLFSAVHYVWYWTRGHMGSPWYPKTHRLFRRASTKDWPAAVASARARLEAR